MKPVNWPNLARQNLQTCYQKDINLQNKITKIYTKFFTRPKFTLRFLPDLSVTSAKNASLNCTKCKYFVQINLWIMFVFTSSYKTWDHSAPTFPRWRGDSAWLDSCCCSRTGLKKAAKPSQLRHPKPNRLGQAKPVEINLFIWICCKRKSISFSVDVWFSFMLAASSNKLR